MSGKLLAIGMMSGTSMDGVDAAIIATDGIEIFDFGATVFVAYSDDDRAILRAALDRAAQGARPGAAEPDIERAAQIVTDRHCAAVEQLLAESGHSGTDIDVIGFHGQTIFHAPQDRFTWQIGDAERLARTVGIDVVCDLRLADVAAGGEGAPMVPVYHRALATQSEVPLPVVVINIGGVANITWISTDGAMIAGDTGPGNALIDDWMQHSTGAAMDADGQTAANGTSHQDLIDPVLKRSYFSRKYPKSLDRNDFEDILPTLIGLSTADGAATLTALTCQSIALSLEPLPQRPDTVIIVGGGTRNPTMMAQLQSLLLGNVIDAQTVGWSPDHIEAQAFGFLAARHLAGLPITFPGTTGVGAPLAGGRFVGK